MAQQGKGMRWNDFERMHVEDGKLYWDSKEVVTKQVFSLRWFELLLATVATLSGLVAALWPIALHLKWLGL